MPNFSGQVDADFYRLIHSMMGPLEDQQEEERRQAERYPFRLIQRIAPRSGSEFPDESRFLEVQCHDLTQGGFSFLLSSRPDFTALVVAFGEPPKLIYVAAEIRHVEEVLVDSSGSVTQVDDLSNYLDWFSSEGEAAKPMFLIGCRFTERLEHP